MPDRFLFVLFASPASADSRWVQQEIEWWTRFGSIDRMILCLTAGTLSWDQATGTFDAEKTDAISATMKSAFAEVPLWLTLSSASSKPELRVQAARIVAAVKSLDLNDLISDDAKSQRRNIATAVAGVCVSVALALGLGVSEYRGLLNRETLAQQRARLADESKGTQSETFAKDTAAYQTEIAQAYDYYARGDIVRAHALLDAAHPDRRSWEWNFLASRLDQSTILQELESGSTCLDINPDATQLAVCTMKDRITLIATDLATKRVLEAGGSAIKGLRFSPEGHSIVAIREDGAQVVRPSFVTPLKKSREGKWLSCLDLSSGSFL